MIRNTEILTLTEYEEDILFDNDDPDFSQNGNKKQVMRSPVSCSLEAKGTFFMLVNSSTVYCSPKYLGTCR